MIDISLIREGNTAVKDLIAFSLSSNDPLFKGKDYKDHNFERETLTMEKKKKKERDFHLRTGVSKRDNNFSAFFTKVFGKRTN